MRPCGTSKLTSSTMAVAPPVVGTSYVTWSRASFGGLGLADGSCMAPSAYRTADILAGARAAPTALRTARAGD